MDNDILNSIVIIADDISKYKIEMPYFEDHDLQLLVITDHIFQGNNFEKRGKKEAKF